MYRIYALYHRELWTVAAVAALLLVEIGMYSWLMTTGIRKCLQSIYKGKDTLTKVSSAVPHTAGSTCELYE